MRSRVELIVCNNTTACRLVVDRFRPIRRDSDSAESQSSASLAGSAPDVDVLPVRLPPRSAGAPNVAQAAAGAAPRHRRLKPTWSSNGSASSYDNLDEPSTPPRHTHLQPWMPQPRSSRLVCPTATKVAGSGTDEALEEPGQRLTPDAPSNVNVSSGSASVFRRPTLGGHMQVVPPTMIGVFDPSLQLSQFAAQTSINRTSPVGRFQRQSSNTANVSETVPEKMILFDDVRQAKRVRNNEMFDTATVRESPHRTLTENSQPMESSKATDVKSYSSCSEPSRLAASKTPEVSETASEVVEPPGDDDGRSLTLSSSSPSSSSSSTDDDQDNAERVKVDDEEPVVCEDVRLPERHQTPTTPASGTRSSSGGSSAAVDDVGERKSEQAATSDEQLAATSPLTPSQDDAVTGGHFADSLLPLPVSATSPSVNEASIQVSSDVEVEQPPDVENEENEALPSSCTSLQSKFSFSSHDEQDGNFVEQTELRISTTDHGTSPLQHICNVVFIYASQQFGLDVTSEQILPYLVL